jgi:hypothetical protein
MKTYPTTIWADRVAKRILKETAGDQLRHLSDSMVHALWDQMILNSIMQMAEETPLTLAQVQARVEAVRQRLGMNS